MIRKVVLILYSSALVSAGVIGDDYFPSTGVSYSSISTPTIVKTITTSNIKKTDTEPINYTKILQSPPVYEAILTTKESKFESPDGTQHSTFSKSFDTKYSSFKNIQSNSPNNGDVLGNSIPTIYTASAHSPIVYNPQTAYTSSYPLIHTASGPVFSKSVSVPITYSTHDIPQTKTVLSPAITSYSTPVVSKTKFITSGLSSYSSPLEYTFNNPTLVKSVPITYTNHEIPFTKTPISSTINSHETPLLSKTKYVTSSLPDYSLNTPVAQSIKTTLTYSDAPIVSHTSFSGLGTNYAW